MKRQKVVRIIAILLIVITSLAEQTFGQENEITEVEFVFGHSLRIPNHYVTVVFQSIHDSVKVHVKSNPAITVSKKWSKTKRDYSFNIGRETFNKIVTAIRLIKCSDVMTGFDFEGNDGTNCAIEFGNFGFAIKYSVWSPDYDTKKRNLQPFLDACRLILTTARLNPDEIL